MNVATLKKLHQLKELEQYSKNVFSKAAKRLLPRRCQHLGEYMWDYHAFLHQEIDAWQSILLRQGLAQNQVSSSKPQHTEKASSFQVLPGRLHFLLVTNTT